MYKDGKFAVYYSTEHFDGEFYMDDKESAIGAALDVLSGWMTDAQSAWDPLTCAPKNQEQRDAWNYMVDTSVVYVYERVPWKDMPDEDDVVWDMDPADLLDIGWKEV